MAFLAHIGKKISEDNLADMKRSKQWNIANDCFWSKCEILATKPNPKQ